MACYNLESKTSSRNLIKNYLTYQILWTKKLAVSSRDNVWENFRGSKTYATPLCTQSTCPVDTSPPFRTWWWRRKRAPKGRTKIITTLATYSVLNQHQLNGQHVEDAADDCIDSSTCELRVLATLDGRAWAGSKVETPAEVGIADPVNFQDVSQFD